MTSETDTSANTPKLLYRLVFSGELLPGFDEAQVRTALTRRLERSPASLFAGKRVTVGEYANAEQAETERRALQTLGARIHVEEAEAPPPMPALGFLEVALPVAQTVEPQATEKFAKTDSPWQPLGGGPAPLPPVGDDLLRSLDAARAEPTLETQDGLPRSTGWPPSNPTSSASGRPPTDLSAVFSTSTATPPPVAEASKVFAPAGKPSTAPVADSPLRAEVQVAPEPPALAVPTAMAVAEPTQAEVPGADWVVCPACSERQPMRLLCRACGADLKRALAAQHEERVQTRAAGGVRGGSGAKAGSADAPVEDDNPRILGFRVPDEWVSRLTWPNVLMALFGFLLLLAAVGFLWRMLGLDPIFSPSSKPTPVVVAPAASDNKVPAESVTAGDKAAPGVGPAPPETEVASRLPSAAAVAEFRQRYWPQPTSKVFVYSSGAAMAWRGGSPSVTRAIAEAMNECESRRPTDAPPCKLVNVNNYWQD